MFLKFGVNSLLVKIELCDLHLDNPPYILVLSLKKIVQNAVTPLFTTDCAANLNTKQKFGFIKRVDKTKFLF